MRLALALAALLPSLAVAQGLTTLAPGQTAQKRTNYALQSVTMSVGTNTSTGWNLYNATVTTAAGGMAGGTWAVVTGNTDSNNPIYMASTTASGSSFVSSVYAKKASGTGAMGGYMNCGGAETNVTCACYRSSGGTCTPTRAGQQCSFTISDLGTTVERVWVVYSCTGNTTTGQVAWRAGGNGVTTYFSGAQTEAISAAKPSKLCVTTTAAKTCNN